VDPVSKTLTAILNWLHAGYPEGVPPTDYFPLLALLNRQLTHDEVKAVAESLIAEGDEITRVDIAVAVTKLTNELPSEQDLHRVAARLTAGGMPPRDIPTVPPAQD